MDASPIGHDKYAIAAVDGTGRILSTEEITATSVLEAEEAAIAMATAIEGTLFIVSDSMSAIRSFRSGQVSETAAKKLQEPAVSIRLLWVPSHEETPATKLPTSQPAQIQTGQRCSFIRQTLKRHQQVMEIASVDKERSDKSILLHVEA